MRTAEEILVTLPEPEAWKSYGMCKCRTPDFVDDFIHTFGAESNDYRFFMNYGSKGECWLVIYEKRSHSENNPHVINDKDGDIREFYERVNASKETRRKIFGREIIFRHS